MSKPELERVAMGDYSIRLATADDRSAVEGIAEAAYAQYIPRMDKKPAPMTEDYAKRIAESQVHVLTAYDDNGECVRGFLVLEPGTEYMLLDNVAVDPRHQGRGYGKALIRFAEETAFAAGYRGVTLYTNEVMVENISLYSRLGFVETHRAHDHGFKRVFMSKQLQG